MGAEGWGWRILKRPERVRRHCFAQPRRRRLRKALQTGRVGLGAPGYHPIPGLESPAEGGWGLSPGQGVGRGQLLWSDPHCSRPLPCPAPWAGRWGWPASSFSPGHGSFWGLSPSFPDASSCRPFSLGFPPGLWPRLFLCLLFRSQALFGSPRSLNLTSRIGLPCFFPPRVDRVGERGAWVGCPDWEAGLLGAPVVTAERQAARSGGGIPATTPAVFSLFLEKQREWEGHSRPCPGRRRGPAVLGREEGGALGLSVGCIVFPGGAHSLAGLSG